MSVKINLSEEIKALFEDENTIKVLATNSKDGEPHVVFKNSVHINEDGNIVHLEIFESSQTNKNLVNSIWFKKTVAVTINTKDKRSYQIKGKPIKALISGAIYENYYKSLRDKFGDIDLSTVWIIEPEELIEETFLVRKEQQEKEHPLLIHLDRLAK